MDYDLIESLTRNFYTWEQRGRGWHVWNFPVDPEPPFVPFYSHTVSEPVIIDDGRKPTFLSSFAERVKDIFYKSSKKNDEGSSSVPQSLDNDMVPISYTQVGAIKELKVVIPNEYKTSSRYIEQCLLTMTMQASIISFEIIAASNSITIQFACRESDATFIEQQLKAYFPESTITQTENSLDKLITYDDDKTVIVDFGLSEEFMMPIKTYDSFDPDPLTGLFGVLDSLNKDEVALVQVLIKAAEAPWADSIMRSVTNSSGDSFFIDAPDMVKLAREKCKHPLFAVKVRFMGKGSSEQRSWEIVKSLSGCLSTFHEAQGNEFIPLDNQQYDLDARLDDVIYRQTHRTGMILNSAELISLVHFPSASILSKKLRSNNQKTVEASTVVKGNEFILGQNVHNGKMNVVSLSHEQRLRHMHVLGATGTGKSTLLLHLIMQDIEHDGGLMVLDPHGDLIDAVLERVPEKRHEDVVLFDPSDERGAVGFNILESQSEIEKNILSSDLVEIFKRFATSWGDQMSVVLGNAISALVEGSTPNSLLELQRFLIEKDFREELLQEISDSHIKYFWEKEYPLLKGSSLGSILTRLDFFLRPKLVRNIVGQKRGVSIKDIVEHKKIFLVKLAQGIIGDENSYLLGSLLVSKLHQVAMQRQNQNIQERSPFYLYVDEFQNFITPSMKAILSGARKYHLGLILAHQDLHQLFEVDMALANAVISNAGIRACFRIGDFDAQKLQGGFAHFDTNDLQNLSVGEAIVRVERSDNDFNVSTSVPDKIDRKKAVQNKVVIIDVSRRKYGSQIVSPEQNKPETKIFPIHNIAKHELSVNKESSIHLDTETSEPTTLTESTKEPTQHRYLQALIKRLAEQRGFKAVIEEPTSDGLGRVDVGLSRGSERIACEISITTDNEHELKNIEKCFRSGYDKVLFCTSDKKRINTLTKSITERLDPQQARNVFFYLPDELVLFFEDEKDKNAKVRNENTIKGYRIKVEYNEVSDKQRHEKRVVVSGVVARALQRMKSEAK